MCAVTQCTGYLSEANKRYHFELVGTWLFFGLGTILILPIWVNIYYNYHYAILRGTDTPPWWVGLIIYVLLGLFMSFAWVHRLYLCSSNDDARALVTAERRYMGLSLLSKTILAWIIFYGALGREGRELDAFHP